MSDHVGLTRRRRFPLRAEEGENQKGIEGEISQDVFFFGGKGRGQRGVDDLDVGLVPDDGVGLGLGQLGECLNGGTWGTKLRERLKASLLEISGTGWLRWGRPHQRTTAAVPACGYPCSGSPVTRRVGVTQRALHWAIVTLPSNVEGPCLSASVDRGHGAMGIDIDMV
jgi:hypothetical protein